MRFISKSPGYRKVAVHQQVEILASGQPRILSEGFTCEFNHGDVNDWERDEARRIFKWSGVPMSAEGGPLDPVNDLHRLSGFDTETIRDSKLRAKVEELLLSSQSSEGHILVERPRAPLPYRKYEEHRRTQGQRKIEHAIRDITEALELTGVNPEAVIAYERENDNDGRIIVAMEALLAKDPQPDDDLVSA